MSNDEQKARALLSTLPDGSREKDDLIYALYKLEQAQGSLKRAIFRATPYGEVVEKLDK